MLYDEYVSRGMRSMRLFWVGRRGRKRVSKDSDARMVTDFWKNAVLFFAGQKTSRQGCKVFVYKRAAWCHLRSHCLKSSHLLGEGHK